MFSANRFSDVLVSQRNRPTFIHGGAALEVIQFGDFECGECGRVAKSIQSYRHQNADLISFKYKHFPVSNSHSHALQAAEAAECARAQGHFWSMHNLLIANQDRLDTRSLYSYAESLGLDMTRFTSEMDEETHTPRVRADIYSGRLTGVQQTPTYFVDGVMVDTNGGLRALFEATRDIAAQRRRFNIMVR